MYWTYRPFRVTREIIRYDKHICRQMSAQAIGRCRLSVRQLPRAHGHVKRDIFIRQKVVEVFDGTSHYPTRITAGNQIHPLPPKCNFYCSQTKKALKLLIFLEHSVKTIHNYEQLADYVLFWYSASLPHQTATKTVLASAQILTASSPYPPLSPPNHCHSTLNQPPLFLGCQIQLVSLRIKLQYAFINLKFCTSTAFHRSVFLHYIHTWNSSLLLLSPVYLNPINSFIKHT